MITITIPLKISIEDILGFSVKISKLTPIEEAVVVMIMGEFFFTTFALQKLTATRGEPATI